MQFPSCPFAGAGISHCDLLFFSAFPPIRLLRRVLRRGGAACYARAMRTISRRLRSATMKAGGPNAELEDRVGRYALRRGLGTWEVTFEGRRDSFSDEQGAEYVVWLLLHPPPQPIHAVALALEARHAPGYTPGAADVIQQRNLGRDDAEVVRSLRRQAREFEAVLADARASEPVKAEARRKREEILEFLRKNPWRSADGTQKCVRAVTKAIKRLCGRLARAVDAAGKPHPVLKDFALHLREHLLIPD